MQEGRTDTSPSLTLPVGASLWERQLFNHLNETCHP